MRVLRGVIVVIALVLIGAVFLVCLNAQEAPASATNPASANSSDANPSSYEISGTVKNGKTLLPGVNVTAEHTHGEKIFDGIGDQRHVYV
jgi:hypothetical protein